VKKHFPGAVIVAEDLMEFSTDLEGSAIRSNALLMRCI